MTEFSAAKSSIIEEQVSISLPPSLFQQYSNDTFTLLFTMLNSSLLLPQNNVTDPSISVASSVISAILLNHEVKDLDDNITIVLRLEYPVSGARISFFHVCTHIIVCTLIFISPFMYYSYITYELRRALLISACIQSGQSPYTVRSNSYM